MRHERPRIADAEARLVRALAASATAAAVVVTIEHRRSRPWSSATFVGAQHDLTLAATASPAWDRWLATLAEAKLPLRGHVVASVAIDPVEAGIVALTVLTLEDG